VSPSAILAINVILNG